MGIFPLVLLLFLGLLPSFAWLIFYVREDVKHPEPLRMIVYAFILGGLVTAVVLFIQLFLNDQLLVLGIQSHSLPSFLALGAIEEIFKFLVIYLFIHKRREFDEPLHAMIYMIIAALGFAAVENVASVIQVANGSLLNIAVFEALVLRFMGATLLHSLTSGLVGYYWGLAFVRGLRGFSLRHDKELNPIVTGLLLATVLHGVFNYLIIKTGPATYAILFVVVVAFFLLSDFEKLKKVDV